MGGRLQLTSIQVTLVFKEEWTDEDVEKLMQGLEGHFQSNSLFIGAYLDEKSIKDVEV